MPICAFCGQSCLPWPMFGIYCSEDCSKGVKKKMKNKTITVMERALLAASNFNNYDGMIVNSLENCTKDVVLLNVEMILGPADTKRIQFKFTPDSDVLISSKELSFSAMKKLIEVLK